MFDITIFTIVYNNYGEFLKQWIENIKKQKVKAKNIIVVLGKNHGVNKSDYKDVKFIEYDSDVMGTLRNQAIKQIKTEWMFYFSIDDELLPNAIEEIKNKSKYDVVGLKYIEHTIFGEKIEQKSALFKEHNLLEWKNTYIPGYIALKRKQKGKVLYYDDISIPNYPYLFKISKYNSISTNKICAIYQRRKYSHGYNANVENKLTDYTKIIDEHAKKYYKPLKGLITNIGFNDTVVNKFIDKDKDLRKYYKPTKDRLKYLKSIGFVKEVL